MAENWFVQTYPGFQVEVEAWATLIIYTWLFPVWSIHICVFCRKPSGHADKEVMAATVLTSLSTSPLVLYPSTATTGNITTSASATFCHTFSGNYSIKYWLIHCIKLIKVIHFKSCRGLLTLGQVKRGDSVIHLMLVYPDTDWFD